MGYLTLPELLDCQDATIRDGVGAMLSRRMTELQEQAQSSPETTHWTAWQGADASLISRLESTRSRWDKYGDVASRNNAIERFRQYAYQWY